MHKALTQIVRLTTATALLATTLISSNALAEDTKSYPGLVCRPDLYGAGPQAVGYSEGRVFNRSGSEYLQVLCPLVRDIPDAKIKKLYISVIDNHPTQSVGCTAHTVRWKNGEERPDNVSHMKSARSRGQSSKAQTLFMGDLRNPGVDGFYYVTCSIPKSINSGQSSIVMMRYVED